MEEEHVGYERRGPLAIIRLERPDALNAITYPMIAGIERRAREAEADPDVFAICITGEGRGFCAGIDMSVLSAHTQGNPPERTGKSDGGRSRPALFSFLLDVSKPVIAAVNGVGAGGGFVLAMMCDLRLMAEDASLITVFSKRGLIAEHGTSWLLPRMVGLGRALDLILTGRIMEAEEALGWGLLTELTDPGRHVERALEIAAGLAEAPQQTMLSDRRAAIEGLGMPLEDGLALEAELGIESIEAALRGAARFAAGEGRGGEGAGV